MVAFECIGIEGGGRTNSLPIDLPGADSPILPFLNITAVFKWIMKNSRLFFHWLLYTFAEPGSLTVPLFCGFCGQLTWHTSTKFHWCKMHLMVNIWKTDHEEEIWRMRVPKFVAYFLRVQYTYTPPPVLIIAPPFYHHTIFFTILS